MLSIGNSEIGRLPARRNEMKEGSPYNYCRNNPLILIDPTVMGDENADEEQITMPQNMMQAANQGLGVGGIIQSGLSWNFNLDKDEVNTNSYIYQRIK